MMNTRDSASPSVESLISKLSRLNISQATIKDYRLPLQPEATALTRAENDIYDRPQWMGPDTLERWQGMQVAATADGISIALVSAYRSIDYQCALLWKKLHSGLSMEEILRVNAMPGYSEHHTGRALDLHDGLGEPLTEAFDQREAFQWLCAHAQQYDFSLTYARDNTWGICYEPWHWCCLG